MPKQQFIWLCKNYDKYILTKGKLGKKLYLLEHEPSKS